MIIELKLRQQETKKDYETQKLFTVILWAGSDPITQVRLLVGWRKKWKKIGKLQQFNLRCYKNNTKVQE